MVSITLGEDERHQGWRRGAQVMGNLPTRGVWLLQPYGGGELLSLGPEVASEDIARRLNFGRWAKAEGFDESRGKALAGIFVDLYRAEQQRMTGPSDASLTLTATFNATVDALLQLQSVAMAAATVGDVFGSSVVRWTCMLLEPRVGARLRNGGRKIVSRIGPAGEPRELLGAFRRQTPKQLQRGAPWSQARLGAEALLTAWWMVFKELPSPAQSRIFINLLSDILPPDSVSDDSAVKRAIASARRGWRAERHRTFWDETKSKA